MPAVTARDLNPGDVIWDQEAGIRRKVKSVGPGTTFTRSPKGDARGFKTAMGLNLSFDNDAQKIVHPAHPFLRLSEKGHEDYWESWFKGKTFTTDWASRAFPIWTEYLQWLRKPVPNILEIGCWEGRASIFLLNFFPSSQITCIDVFTLGNEALFDANVAEFSGRVTKIKDHSVGALDQLWVKQNTYDLIYVDASHDTDDVMMDSLLAWKMSKPGTIFIWDDYEIFTVMAEHFEKHQDPKPAIDAFMQWHADELEPLHRGYQMMAKRVNKPE